MVETRRTNILKQNKIVHNLIFYKPCRYWKKKKKCFDSKICKYFFEFLFLYGKQKIEKTNLSGFYAVSSDSKYFSDSRGESIEIETDRVVRQLLYSDDLYIFSLSVRHFRARSVVYRAEPVGGIVLHYKETGENKNNFPEFNHSVPSPVPGGHSNLYDRKPLYFSSFFANWPGRYCLLKSKYIGNIYIHNLSSHITATFCILYFPTTAR